MEGVQGLFSSSVKRMPYPRDHSRYKDELLDMCSDYTEGLKASIYRILRKEKVCDGST